MTKAEREYKEFLEMLMDIERFFVQLEVEEILDNNA